MNVVLKLLIRLKQQNMSTQFCSFSLLQIKGLKRSISINQNTQISISIKMTHLLKHLFKHPVPVGFATIWVISKDHDAAPTKFWIGHQLTLGSALDRPKNCRLSLFRKKIFKIQKIPPNLPYSWFSKSLKIWEFWGANTNKVKPLNHFLWKIISSPSYGT